MRKLVLTAVFAVSACGPGSVPSLSVQDRANCDLLPLVLAKQYADRGDDPYGLIKEAVSNSAKPTEEVGVYLIGWQLTTEEKVVAALSRMKEIAPNAYARLCADVLR